MRDDSALLVPVNHTGTLTVMPRYLSPAWLAAAAAAVADDTGLQELAPPDRFVLQQEVVNRTDADPGPTTWHVVFSSGGVELIAGPAGRPDVTLRCDTETAHRIHDGRDSAQQAFMEGRLQLGGDPHELLRRRELLASLTDALGPLRPSAP